MINRIVLPARTADVHTMRGPIKVQRDDPELERKLVEHLYGQIPTVVVGSLVLYVLNAFLYRELLSARVLTLWSVLFVLATGARSVVWWRFRRFAGARPMRQWRWAMIAIQGCLGACWSSLAIACVIELPPNLAAVSILNIAGVLGSAVANVSASVMAFRAIVLTGLVPLGLTLVAQDNLSYQILGAMTFTYVYSIGSAARRVHETIRQSIEFGQVNEGLVETLEALSSTDPMTGLLNRRGLEAAFSQIWQDPHLGTKSLGFLLCDVDHFKAYNDALGHLEGDLCLERVANGLKDVTRYADLVSRFGGEEFALLVPDCEPGDLEAIAHRVCESIRCLALPHPTSPVAPHVTISVGAALAKQADQVDKGELIGAADRALYAAKAAGRDGYLLDSVLGRNGMPLGDL